MEKLPKNNSVDFFRHSQASYKTYAEAVKSSNPEAPIDPDKQVIPDLPESGRELAKGKAEEYFSKLDPKTDALFFVSSEEVRALETADIFRQVAREKGFEIIKPEHTRSKTAETIGGGEIRKVGSISLGADNPLASYVFNPKKYLGEINWKSVGNESKEKWEQARKIIDGDDKGSWAENFYYHSEEIQKIFPELKSSRQQHETTFQNLVRLIKFGLEKAEKSDLDKNIKIIAFGHDNYMGYALNKYFGEHGLGNCELVHYEYRGEQLMGSYRNKEKEI